MEPAVSRLSSHQTPLYDSKSSCSRSIEFTNVAGRGLFPSTRALLGITFMKRLHCFLIHLGDILHILFCSVSVTFSFSETHVFRTFILFDGNGKLRLLKILRRTKHCTGRPPTDGSSCLTTALYGTKQASPSTSGLT